jgi:Zn-dependent M28 family amino/carboxypeptidase
VLARLTGEEEAAPGVTIPDRATVLNRMRAREYLADALRALGLAPQLHSYATGANVYARLDATTGGTQHLVLGAHFDTVGLSPGADDNGSGVAAVLAVARHLQQLGCRSRPVLFVLFDEEERGFVGSKEFARKLADDKLAVHSVHTVDQVAWDRNGDRLVELELPDTGLRALYEAAVAELSVALPLVSTTTRSSDHSSFRPTFPAVGITEGYTSRDTSPNMHRNTDRLPTLELGYLRSTSVLVMRVFADLLR